MLFLPHTWNNGMLVFKEVFSLIIISNLAVDMDFDNNPLYHFPIAQYSNIPVFQHSNWDKAP